MSVALMVFMGGAAVGAAHAMLLAASAAGTGSVARHPLALLVRLTLVGAFFVAGAALGEVISGPAGWIAGFTLGGAFVHWRLR